ncbi:glycosyltransferase family 8 protein [Alteromonas ponticola]|uniref:Glycosyltransferase family 8 protein n=1 Tax=Alteromonas aquimaris TaxID=2998417 RepID=A0ABT3P528_9ALTE|nr:glycosyltransferase family 8 protein [Alteromonas aquimaris]MCW8107610.1 glycosyltransferase family 8 protein [Alteromonas aquimaris]
MNALKSKKLEGPLEIVITVDDKFCCHLWVLLRSIVTSCQCEVNFHVIANSVNEDSKVKLKTAMELDGNLTFYDVDEQTRGRISALPLSASYLNRLDMVTYLRLLLAEILPDSIKRVLYLDCDMVALGDISELAHVEISEFLAAVVSDAKLSRQDYTATLGMHTNRYFNAGLMLINLEKWRSFNVAEKALQLLCSGKQYAYNDQDVLNILFQNKLLYLSSVYNFQTYDVGVSSLANNAKIVHFTTAEKPWHASSVHPFRQYYWKIRNQGPYKGEPEIYLDSHDKLLIAKLFDMADNNKSKVVICGAGHKGRRIFQKASVEETVPIKIIGFIDKQITSPYQGVPVKNSPKFFPGADYFVIASQAYTQEIYQTLIDGGVNQAKIISI